MCRLGSVLTDLKMPDSNLCANKIAADTLLGIVFRNVLVLLLLSASGCGNDEATTSGRFVDQGEAQVFSEIRALRETDDVPLSADASGAVLQGTTQWVLPEYSSSTLVLLDSTGRETKRLGGRGGAPGEFGLIDGVFSLHDDTIAVFDRASSVIKYFVHGRPGPKISRLEQWPFGTGFGLVLAGRLANGEWIALRRAPRNLQATRARLVTDTPSLVIGRDSEAPRVLMALPSKAFVDITTGGGSYRLSIDEVAPRTLAICERGFVVVDTSGIRYYDSNARMLENTTIPIPRMALSPSERLAILANSMRRVPLNAPALEARKILEQELASVDSAFNVPVIDAAGNVWITPITTQGSAKLYRLEAKGGIKSFRFPSTSGLERVGFKTLIGRTYDIHAGESYLGLFRIPGDIPTQSLILGTCGRPIRF